MKTAAPSKRPRVGVEKAVADPIKFMVDTGLWWYLNLKVFHPLGLDLVVEDPRTGAGMKLIDRREHPDPSFTKEELMTGQRRLNEFMQTQGKAVMNLRKRLKGFVTQPAPKARIES